jgi:hypothetical protein
MTERQGHVWHGRAFGVPLTTSEELETLSASTEAGPDAVTWTRITDREGLSRDWMGVGATRLMDTRSADGSSMMSIDTDVAGAYLVEARGYGTHAISADGMRITTVLQPDALWNWQRLFVAQALPLAATIRGLELLHASAVILDGRAVAFTASSGTGKTSIAMHLVARGARLLTDDVLAIEMTSSSLLAHPGARLLSARRHELAAVSEGRARLGELLGQDEKIYLRPPLEPEPQPLAALYRLVRQPVGGPFRIVEEAPPDPPALLATSFLSYLKTPERLTRHLELVFRLAGSVPVFLVHLPSGLPAQEAALHLEQHAQNELTHTN